MERSLPLYYNLHQTYVNYRCKLATQTFFLGSIGILLPVLLCNPLCSVLPLLLLYISIYSLSYISLFFLFMFVCCISLFLLFLLFIPLAFHSSRNLMSSSSPCSFLPFLQKVVFIFTFDAFFLNFSSLYLILLHHLLPTT